MNKNRNQLLAQKANELETSVQEWAEQNKVLGAGEKIKITLEIKSQPVVESQLKIPEQGERIRGGAIWRRLTPEEWEKLLAIARPTRAQILVRLWQAADNEPLSHNEVLQRLTEEEKKEICTWYDLRQRFHLDSESFTAPTTQLFRAHGLPFRIRAVKRENRESKYAICIVPNLSDS